MRPAIPTTRKASVAPRPIRAWICLAIVLTFLFAPRAVIAKPQISIACDENYSTYGAAVGFYLWYNVGNSNESSWDNYIWVDLYKNGSEYGDYEDTNDYQVPNTTGPYSTDPCSPTTGSETATASADMVVLNDAGEWNGASATSTYNGEYGPRYYFCPPCYRGRHRGCYQPCYMPCARRPSRSRQISTNGGIDPGPPDTQWDAQILGKTVSGSNVTLTLDVVNNAFDQAMVHFTYVVLWKSSATASTSHSVNVVPVSGTTGHHVARRVRGTANPNGQGYPVAAVASGIAGNYTNTTDFVINLSDPQFQPPNIPAGSTIYVDVVAVNTWTQAAVQGGAENNESIALPRFQISP